MEPAETLRALTSRRLEDVRLAVAGHVCRSTGS